MHYYFVFLIFTGYGHVTEIGPFDTLRQCDTIKKQLLEERPSIDKATSCFQVWK